MKGLELEKLVNREVESGFLIKFALNKNFLIISP